MIRSLIRLYAAPNDRRGLGDAIQFIIVLKHIIKTYNNWEIFVETSEGKDSCYNGFAKYTYEIHKDRAKESDFDKVINLNFAEPNNRTTEKAIKFQVPATKVTDAIFDNLHIEPDPKLFNYEIKIQETIKRKVKSYIDTLPINKGIVGIHAKAVSSPHNKDIDDRALERLCNSLIHNGYTPLILSWKDCHLIDQKKIFCPIKDNSIWEGKNCGDAATIASLIDNFKLFVGVDSGPLHVAGTTNTPTLGYWKFHHPIHYYDLCNNVWHMVPKEHLKYIRAENNKSEIDNVFQSKYKHKWYDYYKKEDRLIECVYELLNDQNKPLIENPKVNNNFIPQRKWLTIKIERQNEL
jgi:hypothetical protein